MGHARPAPPRPRRLHGAGPRRGADRSWSTCSAASTSTRSARSARRRRLDDRAPRRAPARGDRREPVLPLRRPGDVRGVPLLRAGPARRDPPRNSDIGGHHVALYVDDLDAAVEHLRAPGRHVLGGPTASKGPAEGKRWIYFLAPWGMQFELVSYPDGKAFDRWNARARAPMTRRAVPADRCVAIGAASERIADHLRAAILAASIATRRADPAGGGRRAARGQPAAGARGAADARGRGADRARAAQGRPGAAAVPARGRRASTGCASGSSRSR